MLRECIAEQIIASPADLADAITSLRFYWNIQRCKGKPLLIEFWAEPLKGGDLSRTYEAVNCTPQGAD